MVSIMEWFSVAITSAVVSALVTGVLTLLNSHLQRRADERKRLSELAMKLAITEWEMHLKRAEQAGKGAIMPPEIYLLRYSKLLPLIEKNKATLENIATINTDIEKLVDAKKQRDGKDGLNHP